MKNKIVDMLDMLTDEYVPNKLEDIMKITAEMPQAQYASQKESANPSPIMLKRILAPVVCCCLILLLSIGVWKAGLFTPNKEEPIKPALPDNSNATVQSVPLVPFPASPIAYDTDPLLVDNDGLPYVILCVGQSYIYYQINPKNYERYGLPSAISENDFGEYLGTVAKEEKGTKNPGITSKEPDLIGSSVSYYKPLSGKAVVVVKSAEYCSVFLLHDYIPEDGSENPSFSELYSLFGVSSENDISYISYVVNKYVSSDPVVTEKGDVTDREKISCFYKTSLSLSGSDNHIYQYHTPEWEQIQIVIHLNNGIEIGGDDFMIGINFYYKAGEYGHMDYCEQLTPDQSETLRNAFRGNHLT